MSLPTATTLGVPYFHRGELIDGIPVAAFGVLVAIGVVLGARVLRRYAAWHGIEERHIHGLTLWVTVTGFLGAHLLNIVAYEWDQMSRPMAIWPPSEWPVLFRFVGISSFGGFLGGAAGWAYYVRRHQLPVRLMADVAIVGLLPAFTIGRIGCAVTNDHIGAHVDPTRWYAVLATDYPINAPLSVVEELVQRHRPTGATIAAWNLGLIEFLYLLPVNGLVLWLAFRTARRMPAGLVAAIAAILYAPVRFVMDYLRPESTDPRYLGFTFAQWSAVLAFAAGIYVAMRVIGAGKPAGTVAPSSSAARATLRAATSEARR